MNYIGAVKIWLATILLAGVALSAGFVDEPIMLFREPVSVAVGSSDRLTLFGAYSGLYNPALLGAETHSEMELFHSSAFGGIYTVDGAAYSVARRDGVGYGIALGLAGGGDIPITALANPDEPPSNDNRPYLVETKSHYDGVLALSAGKALSSRLSLGIGAIGMYRYIAGEKGFGGRADAGALFQLDNKTRIGFSIGAVPFMHWQSGTNEMGKATPRLGFARKFTFVNEQLKVKLSAESEYAIAEHLFGYSAGASMHYRDIVGFGVGIENGSPAAGASLFYNDFGVAVAMESHSALGESYRIGVLYRMK